MNAARTLSPRTGDPAQDQYQEILDKLFCLDPESADLVPLLRDLEDAVSDLICIRSDQAFAAALGGFVVAGEVVLPDSLASGIGIRAVVDRIQDTRPASGNPSFDECKCAWGRTRWQEELDAAKRRHDDGDTDGYVDLIHGERLHGMLLGLDGDKPVQAIADFLCEIREWVVPTDTGMKTLVSQHNWRDPVGMSDLAETIDLVWNDWKEQ